jgi:hypothetical protein
MHHNAFSQSLVTTTQLSTPQDFCDILRLLPQCCCETSVITAGAAAASAPAADRPPFLLLLLLLMLKYSENQSRFIFITDLQILECQLIVLTTKCI